MTLFPGFWCDVFPHPEGIGLLIYEPAPLRVALYVNSVLRGYTAVSEPLLYLRACSDPSGQIAFIAQPNNTANRTMLGMVGGTTKLIPLLCYNRPAVAHDGVNFVFYVQTGSRTWRRFANFDGSGADQPIPTWPGGDGSTSQGISQVFDCGKASEHVVWHDEVQHVTVGGLSMFAAVSANGVTVGQGAETGMVGVDAQQKHFLAMDFAPQEPRIAYSPGRGIWAVCSHNLKPEVGYNEMPPFTPLHDAPPEPPSGDDPPTIPIVSFPNYRIPDITPIGRPLDVGPFFATDLRAGDFAAPGNRQIVCNGSALVGNDLMHVPVYIDLQSSFNPPELLCGFFAPFANTNSSMGNAGLTCAWKWHLERFSPSDMLRYFDGPEVTAEFIAQCEANAIVLVQCYPLPGETVSISMARFRASVKRVTDTGRDVGIVPALNSKFGGNGTFAEQVATILAIQEPLVTLVRETPKCKKVFYFSYGRWKKINGKIVDCGAAYSAELQMWAKKWASLAN